MTKKHLSNLFETTKKGDAREESYYKHLAEFLSGFSETQRKKKVDSASRKQSHLRGIDITILPKKTEAGNPDFRIWDGKQKITGYIEAKDLGVDLDNAEDSDQLKRYLLTFPNVLKKKYGSFK